MFKCLDLPGRHSFDVCVADSFLPLHGELPHILLRRSRRVRREHGEVRRQDCGGRGDLVILGVLLVYGFDVIFH